MVMIYNIYYSISHINIRRLQLADIATRKEEVRIALYKPYINHSHYLSLFVFSKTFYTIAKNER